MSDEQISRMCLEIIILPVSDEIREEAQKIRIKFEANGSLSWYYKNKLKTLRKSIDEFVGPWDENDG